ncbi:MAG TPA: hypothetical protein VFB62_28335, partial [Polyangiaceae bacterium]|nr:hypothetical protein [Polyangiaceae bacterium]
MLALVASCHSDDETRPTVMMDYTRPTFLSAPWPSETLRRADGGIAIDGFPNPTGAPIVGRLIEMIGRDARGFSTTAGIFLALTGPIDQHDIASFDSVDAPVFLVPIENGAMGPRHPVEVRYREDGGPFGAPHLLSVLPLQGKPLAPHTLYAAVVTTALVDRSPAMDTITNARYQEALAALSGIDVAGLAVFETDDPTITMIRAREAAPVPSVATPFVRTDLFDSFCVYQATVPMPVYQSGTPPYEDDGGWLLDESGVPVLQGEETARIVV